MSPFQDICPTARVRLVGGAPATCGRPPKAGSRQGLKHCFPVTKPNSGINRHIVRVFPVAPALPGGQGPSPRIEDLHGSHAPGPSSMPTAACPNSNSNVDLLPTPARPCAAAGKNTRHQDGIAPEFNAASPAAQTSTSSRVSCPAGSSAPLRPHERQRTYRP